MVEFWDCRTFRITSPRINKPLVLFGLTNLWNNEPLQYLNLRNNERHQLSLPWITDQTHPFSAGKHIHRSYTLMVSIWRMLLNSMFPVRNYFLKELKLFKPSHLLRRPFCRVPSLPFTKHPISGNTVWNHCRSYLMGLDT